LNTEKRVIKPNSNLIEGLLIFIGTTVYFLKALELQQPFQDGQPGPAFYPLCLAAALYICSIVLIIKGMCLKEIKNETVKTRNFPFKKTLIAIILTSIYLWVFLRIGFWISTILYGTMIAFVMEYGKRKIYMTIILSALIGIIVSGAVYVLFGTMLGVKLP